MLHASLLLSLFSYMRLSIRNDFPDEIPLSLYIVYSSKAQHNTRLVLYYRKIEIQWERDQKTSRDLRLKNFLLNMELQILIQFLTLVFAVNIRYIPVLYAAESMNVKTKSKIIRIARYLLRKFCLKTEYKRCALE